MRPVTDLAANFLPDQQTKFEVKVWDTPYAFLEGGRASGGMQLRVREPKTTAAWATYTASVRNATTAAAIETAFADSSGTSTVARVSDGRVPLVEHYWGSGGPNWWGSTTAGQVAVCFAGKLVPSAQYAWLSTAAPVPLTFAAAGSGSIKIVKVPVTGVSEVLLSADLSEVNFLQSGFQLSTTSSFTPGDVVRVYYVQRGTEDWGGLVVKVIAGSLAASAADKHQQAAEAPVLSAGLFSQDDTLVGTEMRFVSSVEVTHEHGAASRATVELPLITPTPNRNDGHGWQYYRASSDDPGSIRLYDAGTLQFTLRRKRLIQIAHYAPNSAGVPTTRVPIFTGFVDDFSDVNDGTVRLNCVGIEGRMVEQYEQAPDRISYMARGFQVTDIIRATMAQKGQPVYNVPAFDAWPLAYAVEELAMRAGIDPSRFRRAYQVLSDTGTVTTHPTSWLSKQFRPYTSNGTAVRLPRPVHYGNTGVAFTETRQIDDDYLFKVEPTKDLWARVRELTDRLGYRIRFDENGDAVLYPSNNATHIVDLSTSDVTSGTATQKTNTSAYGAAFLEATQAVTVSKQVTAARIDIAFPRGANLGSWTVNIRQGATIRRTVTINPNAADAVTTQHLFSSQLTQPDANSCVVTVWPAPDAKVSAGCGTYTVELIGTGAATRQVDCLLCYAVDPDRTLLPTALSTSNAAITTQAVAQQDEMRNKVTIVGRRTALVTDSDKFAESRQPTEREFVVQNAVDEKSITDPTALNYIGYKKESVIYDASIGDNGFARYLAKTFIYRQRVPKPGATVQHTLLPMMQPGDPILVTETRYETLNESTVYVKAVTHRLTEKRATTELQAQAWPDYPAFEPRYDINLANFGNQPVIDFALDYTTLSGHAVSNLNGDAVRPVVDTPQSGSPAGNICTYTGLTASGNAITLPGNAPWPPMPGTVQVMTGSLAGTGNVLESVKTVTATRTQPGQQLIEFTIQPDWDVTAIRGDLFLPSLGIVSDGPFPLPTQPTDGIPFYYKRIGNTIVMYANTKPEYLYNGWFITQQSYRFRLLVYYRLVSNEVRSGWLANNPYHDFVGSINYNNGQRTLTLPWSQGDNSSRFARPNTTFSVRYKSLFPPQSGTDPNVRPATVADNGEPYSPFYDPYTSELGNLIRVQFSVLAEGLYRASIRSAIDGTVVAWLTGSDTDPLEPEKHWEYLTVGGADFYWDGVDQIGEWNARQSELYATLVDGAFGQDGEQRERVGKGFYVWNQEVGGGRFPQLAYIWLKRDGAGKPVIGHGTYGQWYVHIESITDQLPGTVTVDSRGTSLDLITGKFIYTHLPEPTKVHLQISDWVSAQPYSEALAGTAANWGTLSTSTPAQNQIFAHINNQKPVRLRFYVEQRPGKLWENKRDEASVKLTRYAHLRVFLGDQTVIDKGVSYPGATARMRTIANRRLVNDDHTNSYPDTGYRKADEFAWSSGVGTTEWIFKPEDFKREFLYGGQEQSVKFGDYLQLEEVPGWSSTRDLASERSQLHFALMSYLFYLSAMVTDRSGRTTWALNTSFVDKSKILTNTTPVTWGDDPMYMLRRTIVCRQWVGEAGWKQGQLAKFSQSTGSLLDRLLEHWWWQHDTTATTIGTTETNWSAFSFGADNYSNWHVTNTKKQDGKLPGAYSNSTRQLGTASPSGNTSMLGTWQWSTTPNWVPSITRDLHPYFLLPPMCLPPMDVPRILDEINDPLGRLVVEQDLRNHNIYLTSAGPNVDIVISEGKELKVEDWGDNAHAEVFSSAIWDMSELTSDKQRFFPATRVDKEQYPCKDKGISLNTLDYVRQDETVHYEDLRGIYSRGQLPAAGVKKTVPVAPYYINTFRYYGIGSRPAFRNPGYPGFHVRPDPGVISSTGNGYYPFRTAFRHEYVWESAAFFPATDRGAERLDAIGWWRTRYLSLADVGAIYYDYGAWTGWKDDVPLSNSGGSPSLYGGMMRTFSSSDVLSWFTPFAATWMPVASSNVLPTTVELVAHLVLVPERRGG